MHYLYIATVLITMMFPVSVSCANGASLEEDSHRRTIGLSLFPAVVLSDKDIATKSVRKSLSLVLVYVHDAKVANTSAEKLRKTLSKLTEYHMDVNVSHIDDLPKLSNVSGLFILEHMSNGDLDNVLSYAKSKKVAVFSPFEDDIRRGVTASMEIRMQVTPVIRVDGDILFDQKLISVAKTVR